MGHLFPPSGVKFDDKNCYILDVTPKFGVIKKVSGFIDALALSVQVVSPHYKGDDIYGGALSNEDKSAINDDEQRQERGQSRLEKRRLDENPSACGHFMNHSPTPNTTLYAFAWEDVYPNYQPGSDHTYDLPNIARTDGGPRYVIYYGSEMVFYDVDEPQFKVKDVCGAIVCANIDIDTDQELLRDYELEPPLPNWAKDWYVHSRDEFDPQPVTDDDNDSEKWRLT
jgi:hypothetical protein